MAVRPPNPIGPLVDDASARTWPSTDTKLSGRYVTLVGLRPAHAQSLYPYISGESNAHLWDYMFNKPFDSPEDFQAFVSLAASSADTIFYAILSNTEDDVSGPEGKRVLGWASYLNVNSTHQSIEVGNLLYTAALQRTAAATEAMYLMAKHAFEDLGYRRYEWKCNALNGPSRRAALRLGFEAEGVFRQHMIVKGRSRDSAWFSMLKEEWPSRKEELENWLKPANFDEAGRQKKRLEDFRE